MWRSFSIHIYDASSFRTKTNEINEKHFFVLTFYALRNEIECTIFWTNIFASSVDPNVCCQNFIGWQFKWQVTIQHFLVNASVWWCFQCSRHLQIKMETKFESRENKYCLIIHFAYQFSNWLWNRVEKRSLEEVLIEKWWRRQRLMSRKFKFHFKLKLVWAESAEKISCLFGSFAVLVAMIYFVFYLPYNAFWFSSLESWIDFANYYAKVDFSIDTALAKVNRLWERKFEASLTLKWNFWIERAISVKFLFFARTFFVASWYCVFYSNINNNLHITLMLSEVSSFA